MVIFAFSGSVALLADTIHNVADASTSLPLWLAFIVGKRVPTKRFTFGYGRAEDLAGLFVVLVIAVSVVVAGVTSVQRRFGVGVASATSEEAAASDTAGVFSCVINILLDRRRRRNLSAVIPTEGTGRASGRCRMACP